LSLETILIETVGWIGALLILASYALLSMGKLEGRSPTYQWMNIVGASGFVINSGYNGAYPSAVLNIVWVGIGLFTIWRLTRRAA
jgi:hypothetical protein